MISCFSAAVSRTYRPPHRSPPDFFEYAILEDRLGHDLLELAVFAAQVLDFRRRRFACRIAQQPLLAGLKEFFAPPVIEIRRQVFTAAERRDALFPAEPSSTIRIFSSAENRRRVCRRISRTTFSVDPAFAMGCLLPWQESVSYFTTLRGPH